MTKKITVLLFAAAALSQNIASAQTLQTREHQLQTVRADLKRTSNDGALAVRGFSVVLIEGNLRAATSTPDGLPPAASKALSDLKDFLPYKSFRLLDTQWTIGTGRMTGRLRGPEGKTYALDITQGAALGDATSVAISRFVLSDVASSSAGTSQPMTFSQGVDASSYHRDGDASAQWYLGQSAALIDTSFRMKIGETVVVGTSHLQGDTALIVLLTAVPSGEKAPAGGR